MKKTETQPAFDGYREIHRKHGTGYMRCIVSPKGKPKYKYEYPFAIEIGDHLNAGDKQTIADVTGVGLAMVRDVLAGRRYNELVLDAAIERIKQNEAIRKTFEPSKGVKEFINDLSK